MSTTAIPDLWPQTVTNVNVITPLAILRYQASQLRARTHGLLEAEVETTQLSNGLLLHNFVVVAPVLQRYRVVLLRANHQKERVYPVSIAAPCFESPHHEEGDEGYLASDQDDFLKGVGMVLISPDAVATIQSLIAQSNEVHTAERSPPDDQKS